MTELHHSDINQPNVIGFIACHLKDTCPTFMNYHENVYKKRSIHYVRPLLLIISPFMVLWTYNLLTYLVAAAVRTFLTILPWQFFISGRAVVFLTVSLHGLQCLRFTHS